MVLGRNLITWGSVALIAGCAATTQARRVETSGFLGGDTYALLEIGREGRGVLSYVNEDANGAKYDKIILEPVAISATGRPGIATRRPRHAREHNLHCLSVGWCVSGPGWSGRRRVATLRRRRGDGSHDCRPEGAGGEIGSPLVLPETRTETRARGSHDKHGAPEKMTQAYHRRRHLERPSRRLPLAGRRDLPRHQRRLPGTGGSSAGSARRSHASPSRRPAPITPPSSGRCTAPMSPIRS